MQHARQVGAQPIIDDGGILGSGSVLRKMGPESVGLLGGGRALLLQIAHPLVAASIEAHSNFRTAPLRRLQHTIDFMHTVMFGDRCEAEAALRRFHTIHAHVGGQLNHAAGRFPPGSVYTANDPQLKLWIFTTLMDTRLLIYERFVAPLSNAERVRFYEDCRLLAELLGIPPQLVPPTLEQFAAYMQEMLTGDTLAVTDLARHMIGVLIDPPVWIVPRAAAHLVSFVTAGLLPERLRSAYGLKWDARRQAALDMLGRTSRALLPLLPVSMRHITRPGDGGFVRWALGSDWKAFAIGRLEQE
jgi:uncharacterized protein (DUF2236 family)